MRADKVESLSLRKCGAIGLAPDKPFTVVGVLEDLVELNNQEATQGAGNRLLVWTGLGGHSCGLLCSILRGLGNRQPFQFHNSQGICRWTGARPQLVVERESPVRHRFLGLGER